MEDTRTRFYKNLELIVTDLLLAYKLEFKKEILHLGEPLHRWIDFRLRFIDPIPRQIFISNKFPKKLPLTAEIGFHLIEELIREGKDVNPYQSKGLIKFNDVSGKRRAKRTDLLWADWGIIHLHITDVPIADGEYFTNRKCSDGESWLLFCLFVGNTAGFIDVRHHDEEDIFSNQDLIKTVKENWPEYMARFKIKGILPGEDSRTAADIHMLRTNGVSSFAIIDGDAYMGPGMGITSASTSTQVTLKADQILEWIDSLAALADNKNGQLQTAVKLLGVENPEFELCLTPQGLSIFEPNANMAFTFSKKTVDEHSAYFAQMVDLLCPEWALQHLMGIKISATPEVQYR